MASPGRAFRELLDRERHVVRGGLYSPLDAQIAERVGMKAISRSGYSVAMLNGWPDMGFLTMTEMTRQASRIVSAVGIPVVADADDGDGSALNTMRTVAEHVKAGVAGIHLEDQGIPSAAGTSRERRSYQEPRQSGSSGRPSPEPAGPRLRADRSHRRLGRGRRQPGRGHLAHSRPTPTPASTWSGASCRARPRPGRALRRSHADEPSTRPHSRGSGTPRPRRSGSCRSLASGSSSSPCPATPRCGTR